MVTRNFYSLFFIFAFLLGCEKPDPAPELKDPIYQDLKSEESRTKKEYDSKIKEIDGLKKDYEKTSDADRAKKMLREDIFRAEKEAVKLRQLEDYYRISAESRQIYARKEYLELYKSGKADQWPNKSSAGVYKKQRELASIGKNWSRGNKQAKKEAAKKPDSAKESKK